jgi:hypothetical protein
MILDGGLVARSLYPSLREGIVSSLKLERRRYNNQEEQAVIA